MLIRHRDHTPVVHPSAYVAPTAVLMGRVTVGPRSRVMSGAIVDAEGSHVDLGECVIVNEHAVLRATSVGDQDHPVLVDDHAFIGPHATLLGCSLDEACYVATGGTVLHGARVGSGAVVAVGALVHGGTVLPPSFFVSPNLIAIGDPVETYEPGDPGLARAIEQVEFARRAFGVEAGVEDRVARYRQATDVRSREFASHFDDEVVGE